MEFSTFMNVFQFRQLFKIDELFYQIPELYFLNRWFFKKSTKFFWKSLKLFLNSSIFFQNRWTFFKFGSIESKGFPQPYSLLHLVKFSSEGCCIFFRSSTCCISSCICLHLYGYNIKPRSSLLSVFFLESLIIFFFLEKESLIICSLWMLFGSN